MEKGKTQPKLRTSFRKGRTSLPKQGKMLSAPKRESSLATSAPVPTQAENFTLSSPGGDVSGSNDVILKLQEVITNQDDQKLLLAATTTTPLVNKVLAVIIGRKLSRPSCNDSKCGQCKRCEGHVFGNRLGERLARMVLYVYDDRQFGLGCLETVRCWLPAVLQPRARFGGSMTV